MFRLIKYGIAPGGRVERFNVIAQVFLITDKMSALLTARSLKPVSSRPVKSQRWTSQFSDFFFFFLFFFFFFIFLLFLSVFEVLAEFEDVPPETSIRLTISVRPQSPARPPLIDRRDRTAGISALYPDPVSGLPAPTTGTGQRHAIVGGRVPDRAFSTAACVTSPSYCMS